MWVFRRIRRRRPAPGRKAYLTHRQACRALVHARLAHFNAAYGFAYNRVSIKNHRSVWGSCSKKGNLNFNYRLVMLPPALVDYVIVHELCHLGEHNHSVRFWALVERAIPDWRALRRQLRIHNVRG